jgi:hypothetical protein
VSTSKPPPQPSPLRQVSSTPNLNPAHAYLLCVACVPCQSIPLTSCAYVPVPIAMLRRAQKMSAGSPAVQNKPPVQLTLSFGRQFGLARPDVKTPIVTTPIVAKRIVTTTASVGMTDMNNRRTACITEPIVVKVRVKLRIVAGTAVAAELKLEREMLASQLSIKIKRITYTPQQKIDAVAAVEQVEGSWLTKVRALRHTMGYEKVTPCMLASWATPLVCKKRGRSRREMFEIDVLDQLIYTQCENVQDINCVAVLANVAYSYDVIRNAAWKVQKMPEYLDDEKVQVATN